MTLTVRQRTRVATLEAKAPLPPLPYDLNCLTDDELIVLATLRHDADGKAIVPPELAEEVARIMAKAEAGANG